MNYEKLLYNKILERARKIYNESGFDCEKCLFELFPELKENEDMKMVKVINSNKVEPNFKVGDWLVTDFFNVVQIKVVKDGYYTTNNGMVFNIPYVDKNWSLWNIKDSKDGDVLISSKNQPFIYNGYFNSSSVGGYCGINIYGVFVVGHNLEKCNWTENKDIKPATKEQRAYLFATIFEEGYKWNTEKREFVKLDLVDEEKSIDK